MNPAPTAALGRRDWLAAGAVLVGALLLRVPVRSAHAYHWDSAQLALALEHFDLRAGLPHAPGFFLYILQGRLVNSFVGDPHASLVWISIGAGALLTALGYLLATAMFGRRAGAATAVILATGILTWFHSAVALTTVVDGALVTATASVAWRAVQTGGTWAHAVGLGVLLAAVAGVRGQTVPGLLPVWLYAFWRMRDRRGAKLLVGLAAAGLAGVAWFGPLIQTCGGLTGYLEVLAAKNAADARYQWWQAGWRTLADNFYIAGSATALGLGVAGAMALAEWVRGRSPATDASRFLWWWALPMAMLGTVVFYTFLPGHVLCYFPALAVAAGAGVARAADRLRLNLAVVLAFVAVSNGALFLTGWDWPRLRLTAAEIREHDAQLARLFADVRARYRPDEVVIAHRNQWFAWGFRHFQYHLPEYENWLLTPDPALPEPARTRYWRARDRRLEFVEKLDAQGRTVLLYEPPAALSVTNVSRW